MNERLRRLLEQRATLVAQARAYNEEHTSQWNEERQAAYDAMMADVDNQSNEVRRLEHLIALEAEERASQGRLVPAGQPEAGNPEGGRRSAIVTSTNEYRDAWTTFVRCGNPAQLRSMNISVDPSGGYAVPDEFHGAMVTALNEYLAMRQYATVIRTSGDRAIPIANMDGEAFWTGEEQLFADSDETLAEASLGGHKLTRLQKVSEELVQDSMFDIGTFLAGAFAMAFAAKEEFGFTIGNGIGKPTGFMLDALLGKTTAANNVIKPDEIIDLFYSLKAVYRRRAIWQMADATICAIRKMQDSTGQYLWQPSLQAGEPDQLLGRPIAPNNSMDTVAATKKVVAFGDFAFYWIADRGQDIVQRLNERYAEYGQVGFRMAKRVDGKLVIPEAVKVLQIKA